MSSQKCYFSKERSSLSEKDCLTLRKRALAFWCLLFLWLAASQSPRQSDKHSKSCERFMRWSWLGCSVSARSTIWADWEMNGSNRWGENNAWFLLTESTDIKAFWDLTERLVCISARQGFTLGGPSSPSICLCCWAAKHFPQFCVVVWLKYYNYG